MERLRAYGGDRLADSIIGSYALRDADRAPEVPLSHDEIAAGVRRTYSVHLRRPTVDDHWPGSYREPVCIVAASSRAEAARCFAATGVPVTEEFLTAFGVTTLNEPHVTRANTAPGTVFVQTGEGTGERADYDFEPVVVTGADDGEAS